MDRRGLLRPQPSRMIRVSPQMASRPNSEVLRHPVVGEGVTQWSRSIPRRTAQLQRMAVEVVLKLISSPARTGPMFRALAADEVLPRGLGPKTTKPLVVGQVREETGEPLRRGSAAPEGLECGAVSRGVRSTTAAVVVAGSGHPLGLKAMGD